MWKNAVIIGWKRLYVWKFYVVWLSNLIILLISSMMNNLKRCHVLSHYGFAAVQLFRTCYSFSIKVRKRDELWITSSLHISHCTCLLSFLVDCRLQMVSFQAVQEIYKICQSILPADSWDYVFSCFYFLFFLCCIIARTFESINDIIDGFKWCWHGEHTTLNLVSIRYWYSVL